MAQGKGKRKCFVVGPIGGDGSETRNKADWLLEGIIRPVLEINPFDYAVERADHVAKPGLITDQVISAVINADLVVADLTGANANAFYELAIRHMEQKPVIHVAEVGTPLPFDIKDYRAVFFCFDNPKDVERAKKELRRQVEAIHSSEYVSSNPVTHARGLRALRKSADSKDRLLAELLESNRTLEARINRLERPRKEPEGLFINRLAAPNYFSNALSSSEQLAAEALINKFKSIEAEASLIEDRQPNQTPPKANQTSKPRSRKS